MLICDAQQCIRLSGRIISVSDTSGIPYASISLKNTCLGVVSNEAGRFVFNIPDSLKNDTLSISCLGYKPFFKNVYLIKEISDILVKLDTTNTELPELMVVPQDFFINLLNKVETNLKNNYPDQIHCLTGFYRELSTDAQEKYYTRVLEADIIIQDRGIKTNLENILIKVNELRKSEDYTEYDRRFDNYNKVFNKIFPSNNKLYSTFQVDPIRNYFPRKNTSLFRIFDLFRNKEANNYLEKIIIEPEGNVYVISSNVQDWIARLWVNSWDFAIQKLEVGRYALSGIKGSIYSKIKEQGMAETTLFRGEIAFQIRIHYHEYSGKYYLSFLEYIDESDVRKIDGKRFFGYTISTFMTNNIFPSRKSFEKIKKVAAFDPNTELKDKAFNYHPSFWESYNLLLESPLLLKAQNDMEQKKKLEEQYRNNDNHK